MDDLIQARAALMAGDVVAAAEGAKRVVEREPDSADAHELLGIVALGAFDDYPQARSSLEASYRLHRRGGRSSDAARLAIRLAQVEETTGNLSVMRGWLSRAKRLLDEVGPCVEEGYYCVAMVGCEVPDVVELERMAERALEIARQYGDSDLEVRALSESGLALISQGRLKDGSARLDEAAAAVVAGEVRDLIVSGLATCSVVSGCERLGDVDRLLRFTEALGRVSNERFRGFQPPIMMMHCRQVYGGLLGEAGRWTEAERELLQALELSQCVGHRASALAQLAQLRIHQNRLDEAAELLRGWEDRMEVQGALAVLHEARGELELAVSTLRISLRERETDLLTSAPLWAHLAEVEVRRGEIESAAEAASRVEAIARVLASPTVEAIALLARGRVQSARGENAEENLVAALARLRSIDRPLLRAEIHLALAEAKRASASSDAIAEAKGRIRHLRARRSPPRARSDSSFHA